MSRAQYADTVIDQWTSTLTPVGRQSRIKSTAAPSFYYQSTLDALTNDGDIMTTLDVLGRQVGILGIFSDWSGTVSYYASCMRLH